MSIFNSFAVFASTVVDLREATRTISGAGANVSLIGTDLLPHLNRIFMEMTGTITFDTRLNALQVLLLTFLQ